MKASTFHIILAVFNSVLVAAEAGARAGALHLSPNTQDIVVYVLGLGTVAAATLIALTGGASGSTS